MPTSRIDANRVRYVYPLLRRAPIYGKIGSGGTSGTSGTGINVEVEVIEFNNTDSASYTFKSTYDSIPVCVISPEDENVNVFITSLSTTAITIGASASNAGKVHLHIYPDDGS
tara:strand:+ start:11163 stop:11501 length:339 start_codon:yes stop_codon:yes gene_type:complete